jgi:polysaccharide chain length determinant protein (PEP-CTERM system associated)
MSNAALLQKYLNILHKFKWHGLIPACAVMLLLGIGFSFLPDIYESACVVEIEMGSIENPLKTRFERPPELREQLGIFSGNALRWNVLSRIIDKIGADSIVKNSDIYGLARLKKKVGLGKEEVVGQDELQRESQKESVVAMLKGQLEFTHKPPRFLLISHRGANSSVNAEIVNTLVTVLIEERTKAELADAGRNYEFIKEELESYRLKLEKAEVRLKEFKEQHISELPSNVNLNLAQLSRDKSELMASELEMKVFHTRLEYINKELERQSILIVSEIRREANPLQIVLNERIVDLEVELTRLRTNYTDLHPRVVEVSGQLIDLKKQREEVQESTIDSETSMLNPIYQQLAQDKQDTLINIEGMKNKVESLSKRVKESEEKITSVPEQEQELLSLTRNHQVTADIYNMLLQKGEEIRIQEKLAAKEKNKESFRVVEFARASLAPAGPDKLNLLLIVLFAGVGVCLGIMFLLDFFDDSFNTVSEAKEFIRKPFLGAIPPLDAAGSNGIKTPDREEMDVPGGS